MLNTKNFDTYFHFDHFEDENITNSRSLFQIVQLGDINCTEDYIGPVHLQLCYEISYIVSGIGKFVCDNVEYPVKKGDIVINRIGEEHYIVSSSYDPMRFYYIGFKMTADNDIFAQIDNIFQNRPFPVCETHSSIISFLFLNLFEEIKNNSIFKPVIIDSCINQLICHTCRNYTEFFSTKEIYSTQKVKTDTILYNAVHYIEHNIRDIKKLTEISDHLGYSYPYVSALFSGRMGQSLKSFFDVKRINIAIDMLAVGKSVTDTAIELNFDSVQSFSHTFKRITGQSPSSYISAKRETDANTENAKTK